MVFYIYLLIVSSVTHVHHIHAFWGHSLEGNKQIVLKPGSYLFHSIMNHIPF